MYNTNPLFWKRFIHCTPMIPFILHWPSPRWVIRERRCCNSWPPLSWLCHVFTTWYFTWFWKVWTRELKPRVNACSIQGVVLCSRRSEDGWQKQGGLLRRSREEPCWRCSTKPWQLHAWKTQRKVVHEAAKVTWRIQKRVVHVDSAARSCESYKNDLEKSCDDIAARSREHRHRNRGAGGDFWFWAQM